MAFASEMWLTGVEIFQRFSRAGPRGRAREWATLGVHPLSWLLSNNRLEEVCGTLTKGTFSSRLLLSNQDKGCTPSSPDQLPKSAILPKWAMLFLIRQSQIQNNPIMHCFNWNNLLFVCGFWASNWLKFIMFLMSLDYWIYVFLILKQNNMFCFQNKKILKNR